MAFAHRTTLSLWGRETKAACGLGGWGSWIPFSVTAQNGRKTLECQAYSTVKLTTFRLAVPPHLHRVIDKSTRHDRMLCCRPRVCLGIRPEGDSRKPCVLVLVLVLVLEVVETSWACGIWDSCYGTVCVSGSGASADTSSAGSR